MYRNFSFSFTSHSILFAITRFFADSPGTCLLHSGGNYDSSQRSFLGLFPYETIQVHAEKLHYHKGHQSQLFNFQNPWEGLQEHFFRALEEDPHAMAFGWFGYGMGAFSDEDRVLPYRPSSIPDAFWERCAVVLDVDSRTLEANIQVDMSAIEHLSQENSEWIKRLQTLEGWLDFIKTLRIPSIKYESVESNLPLLQCSKRKGIYLNQVEQAQELIRAGEIYQINLSQNFLFQSTRDPFSLFQQVSSLNPAPFSAYFRHQNFTLISTSPERFLSKKGTYLETRPIKGTIQRGKTKEEDRMLQERLLSSPKEKAELLMITDLMRNDLGKISAIGSVKTVDLWRCEAYANVFHLVSTIRSQAKQGLKSLEIIRSCFPGGSITGCPKLRAMEAIDALEERSRGIYTGSIGYMNGKGDFDLNIAIRTLVAEGQSYSLQLGAGIVIDSNPEQEYQETLFKGASIFHILQTKEIFEKVKDE